MKLVLWSFVFITFLFTPSLIYAARTTPLIIDHHAVAQFNSLTDTELAAARNLKTFLHHASVGEMIGATHWPDNGLDVLQASNPTKYNRANWTFWNRSNPPWDQKITMFAATVNSELGSNPSKYDVMAMKMCYREASQLEWKNNAPNPAVYASNNTSRQCPIWKPNTRPKPLSTGLCL